MILIEYLIEFVQKFTKKKKFSLDFEAKYEILMR